MFGIGFTELVVIGIIALVFIGPKKLPEVANQFGRFFVKFRKATHEARQTVDGIIKNAEREIILEERTKIKKALEDIKSVALSAGENETTHRDANEERAKGS